MVIVAVLVLAAAIGFAAQRRLLGRRSHDDPLAHAEGLPASELVIPVRTLAALLLAFVLLSVYTSFKGAGDHAAAESGAVLAMAEDAAVLTPDARTAVIGSLQCYARSVIGPDWRSQVDDGHPSPLTDDASDRISSVLADVAENRQVRNSVGIASILNDDSLRIQTRTGRLEEGRSSVPSGIWALLIFTVAVMIGGLAALGHPSVRWGTQVGVLVGTTAVFALALLMIDDLDHAYSGSARIKPSAMINAERRIAALPGAPAQPPCDAEGRARVAAAPAAAAG